MANEYFKTLIAAHQGDRDSQYALARFSEEGIGLEKDMEQAVFWYRRAALQNHEPSLAKCRELNISLHLTPPDRETARRELRCRMYPLDTLPDYKFVVLCSRYQDKWLFSRHKKRSTWETQGGHIEPGETPMDCAKRELFEESGVQDAQIIPVCDYWGFDDYGFANGVVFLAIVHSLGDLPESEMKETGLFEELPENLTYPMVTPVLCREAENRLKKRI